MSIKSIVIASNMWVRHPGALLFRSRNMEDAIKQRIEELEGMVGQAYQVIGGLADKAGLFEDPEVIRALDYFSQDKYDDDFLPWGWRA